MNNDKIQLSEGSKIIIGIHISGKWCVSCWVFDYDLLWEKFFNNESEARAYFNEFKHSKVKIDG
jgi:hypothetical protein